VDKAERLLLLQAVAGITRVAQCFQVPRATAARRCGATGSAAVQAAFQAPCRTLVICFWDSPAGLLTSAYLPGTCTEFDHPEEILGTVARFIFRISLLSLSSLCFA
ncbi:unnamed protein product, partial [Polarella glacialis]